MLMAAGHPEAKDGQWSDNMIDDVVFWGDETKVAERIQELFSFGATEVLASPFARRAGPGRAGRRPWTGRCVCWAR